MVARLVAAYESDEEHREGRYFAHALILREEDFLAAGGDPDIFFTSYPFLRSVEEAKQEGDWQTGLIDDHLLATPRHDDTRRYQPLWQWPAETVSNLLLLADARAQTGGGAHPADM